MTSKTKGPGAHDAGTRKPVLLSADSSKNSHRNNIAQAPRRGSSAALAVEGEAQP
jgi:hypothetical protein